MPDIVFPAVPACFADRQSIQVIDSHTCGQPTRVVVQGAGIPPGTDPLTARDMLANERDWVRRMAVFEPRGHRSMFAVTLIEPGQPGDPYGLVFMDANGYPDMCGHATIGAVTTLFSAGYLQAEREDMTGSQDVVLSVPMGRLQVSVRFEHGACVSVAFRTPLAYYLGRQEIVLSDGQHCAVDVAHGGQWYGFLSVEHAGGGIQADRIDALIAAAGPVRQALREQLTLVDPVSGQVPVVGNIVWTTSTPEADARNVPISSAGSYDRSPCGTATCARMAALAGQGQLAVGQAFVNQGLVGTLYHGRLLEEKTVGPVSGYTPEVAGSAWLTGAATFWRDPRDPLGDGFLT